MKANRRESHRGLMCMRTITRPLPKDTVILATTRDVCAITGVMWVHLHTLKVVRTLCRINKAV
jgi:hypothetical protein